MHSCATRCGWPPSTRYSTSGICSVIARNRTGIGPRRRIEVRTIAARADGPPVPHRVRRRGPARRHDDRPAQRRSRAFRADRHRRTSPAARALARNRGLDSFVARLPGGAPVVCATSGMGAPSMSIVVNELVQAGIRTVIRVGTAGSIQEHVRVGSVVIGSGALTNQGAADDIAPPQFPAVADPFLTVALADAARRLGIDHHVGVMASTDTFFEGQERSELSANPHLLRRLRGMIDEYHDLGVLNFEMEAGTLFKMGAVYGFAAGCVCAIIAQRTRGRAAPPRREGRRRRPGDRVAIAAADAWTRAGIPGRFGVAVVGLDEDCRRAVSGRCGR